VGYDAGTANVRITPLKGFSVTGHGERYGYDATGLTSPLVDVQSDGWRWSISADASPRSDVDLSGGYHRELGPGAGSTGFEGSATYRYRGQLSLTASGASLLRPLEFRFDDSQVWMVGLRAEFRPTPVWSLAAGVSHYGESRNRPDAANFDWNQTRVDIRITALIGSNADADRLPPAVPSGKAP
jgi:hypothetical protein